MTESTDRVAGKEPRGRMSGLAVWSFVLGLLFFVPFVGLAAILLGILAMGSIGNSEGALRGRGLAVAGTLLGLFSIVFMCLLVPTLFFFLVFAGNKQRAEAVTCRSNLRQIGVAIQMYKSSHGELPPSLQVVVDKGYVSAGMLRCPSENHREPADSRNVDARSDYYYAYVRDPSGLPQPVPIAWDKRYFHGVRGVNVLFASGQQRFLSVDELQRLVDMNTFRYAKPPQLPSLEDAPLYPGSSGGGMAVESTAPATGPPASAYAVLDSTGRTVKLAADSTSMTASGHRSEAYTARLAKYDPQVKRAVFTFQCKSTRQAFQITEEQLADAAVYRTYMVDYGTAADCRICGAKDARQVYYCAECKERYAYEPRHETALVITCPKGHKIPRESH